MTRFRPVRARAALLVLAVAVVTAAGCGVDVPDDVAARATATTPTTAGQATTTVPPTSDDPLEQALIDNGYTVDEARCGAARLRQVLDDAAIEEIIEADSIEDIDPDVAAELTDALRDCVEDATDEGDSDDGGSPGDGGSEDDPPGRRGGPRRPTVAAHP